MGQGDQRSGFLLALDFGKEIHSVFNEVMLGQNFMLAKSLCFVYIFLPFFCLLFVCFCVHLFVFFCIMLFCFSYAQSISFVWKTSCYTADSCLASMPSSPPSSFSILKCIIFTNPTAEESPFSPFQGFFSVRRCSPSSLLVDVSEKLITGLCVPKLCFPIEGNERHLPEELFIVAGIMCSFVNKTENIFGTSALLSYYSCVKVNLLYVPPPLLEQCISFLLFLALLF